uniref:Uncharacterized protein n=1 Tax=Amphiprion ocellaris TaxID=80972 RepID=A0A3Q1BRY4_AMPOC
MANDKNPLGQLKDLVELKDQLEDIQRRVEDEIQAGVPPGGSLLASPFLKGFLAGYVVARLRSSALMGVVVGTCTGIYAAQNYAVPNIENTVKDYIRNLKGGSNYLVSPMKSEATFAAFWAHVTCCPLTGSTHQHWPMKHCWVL